MINDASALVRQLMTGKDGRIFVEDSDGNSVFLAEVDQFTVNMNVTNADVQPVGSPISYALNTVNSFSLTFSEMVVRDDLIMNPIVEMIRNGKMPTFTFQAGAERWDGQEQRITLRNCTPDGEFNLMNITPGEVVKRNQTYRINSIPEWLKTLSYTA